MGGKITSYLILGGDTYSGAQGLHLGHVRGACQCFGHYIG